MSTVLIVPALPTHPTSTGLRDNHSRGSVADFLRAKVQPESRLSLVSAYFTIYAYDELKDCLDKIGHLDVLFGEPSFVNRLDPNKTEKKSFIIEAGEMGRVEIVTAGVSG